MEQYKDHKEESECNKILFLRTNYTIIQDNEENDNEDVWRTLGG